MFNPKKPYNELPLLPPTKVNFESRKIQKQLTNSKIGLARLDTLIRTLDDKEIFLEHFAIRESVESSQIENINTTIETTYEAEYETNLTKGQKETLQYKKALMVGFNQIKNRGFINRNGIQDIGLTLDSSRGYIRTTSNAIKKKSLFGFEETIYTPPIGTNSKGNNVLDDLFKNLENFYNDTNYGEIDPLIRMALIHYQFEAIHPFGDGNGRTGRILMVLYLMLHKQLSYPILFISAFINSHKSEYYEGLMNITTKKRREDFVYYILVAIDVQSKKTVDTIEKLIKYRKKVRNNLFKLDKIKAKDLEVIYKLLSSKPYISLELIIEKSGVSKDTGTKIFNILIDSGFGKEKRVGYKKVLVNKNFLKIFNK